MSEFKFTRLTDKAFPPVKAHTEDAGYDLRSAEFTAIPPRSNGTISTDLSFELPENTYARIAPRSGLAKDHKIDVGGGVVDRNFTGVVKVILFNHSDHWYIVKQGERIAQVIITKIEPTTLVEVIRPRYGYYGYSARQEKGFGSTGLN